MTPHHTLREAHAHLPMHGRGLAMLRLDTVGSVDECLDRVRHAAAASKDPSSWLLGIQVRPEGWSDARWPTMHELDDACPDRPCCLMSFDHHSVVVNSRAFAQAGFSQRDADPSGGVIVRNAAAEPTGVLLESAAMKAWHAAPEPTESERQNHVRAALDDLAALGFTEVHDLLSPRWLGPVLAEFADAGSLPMRVGLFAPIDEFETQAAAAQNWNRPGQVELLGGKVFADGTLNSRTAWMLHLYRRPHKDLPRGKHLVDVDFVRRAIRQCSGRGLGLAVHAIGDAAVRCVLDAAEDEREWSRSTPRASENGSSLFKSWLRIEHAELVDAADVPRFSALGVVASVQPCHLLTDIEVLEREMPDRLDRVLPLRELIDAGAEPGRVLVFGSDTPIVRPNPEDSIQAAVHRRRVGMNQSHALGWSQRITEAECRTAFGDVD